MRCIWFIEQRFLELIGNIFVQEHNTGAEEFWMNWGKNLSAQID